MKLITEIPVVNYTHTLGFCGAEVLTNVSYYMKTCFLPLLLLYYKGQLILSLAFFNNVVSVKGSL